MNRTVWAVLTFITASAGLARADDGDGHRHRPRDHARRFERSLQEIGAACSDAFWQSDARGTCTAVAARSPARVDPVAAIAGCVDAFWATDKRLACVSAAVNARRDLPVAACVDAFWSDDKRLACVRVASTTRVTGIGVAACADAFWADDKRLACVGRIGSSRYGAVELVGFCKDQYWNDDERLRCVGSFGSRDGAWDGGGAERGGDYRNEDERDGQRE